MKIYNSRYILPMLLVFLVLVTLPIWRGGATRMSGFHSPPNPNGERCIEPKSFMRAEHMRLLIRWRDEVVRHNERIYVASDGRHWVKSLRTCMSCHGQTDAQGHSTTAAASCDSCHNYVDAKPDCWNCHYDTATPTLKMVIGNPCPHALEPDATGRDAQQRVPTGIASATAPSNPQEAQ